MSTNHIPSGFWWEREDLGYRKGRLFLGDQDLLDLVESAGTPLYAYNAARVIAGHARAHNVEVHVEPGDYLVKDAAVLILQVNTVEEKGGTKFVGVNGGFNIQNLAVYYDTPFIAVPLIVDMAAAREKVTIAGNINEVIDLLAEGVVLPPVREGDYLGFLNVGGYGAASSSNHCMRGTYSEYLLVDEQNP